MRIMHDQDQVNKVKNTWQAILYRMRERRLNPTGLASRMNYSRYSRKEIERGIAGEPVSISLDFLRDCVLAFGLPLGRAKHYEETVDTLSYEELVGLIKPPPAMPPRQGNFWEWHD